MPQSALRQFTPQSAEPFVRSYNPLNPAFRDTVRSGITDLLGGRAMGGTPTQRYRAGMADLLTGAVDFAPGIGEAVGVADTVQAARGGNYGTAAILGGATVLGMAPLIGDAASKAIRGGLDMSQSARMQRAAEQGFNVDMPVYQSKTEYELAHEVAQRNAAKPISEGGLGLPANNTAMDRANAMGFDTSAYHGTGNDFDAFDPGMSEGARFNTGVFMSASPDVASTYALGEQRQVLPLMYRAENPINVYAEGANWNRLGPNTRVDLPARTVNQSEDADILRALGVQIEDTQEMLPRTTTLKQLFPEVYGYEDDFMDTNDFSRWAKRQGVDAVVFNDIVDRGPSGTFSNKKALMPARNIVSFDPSNIRSVNAAFDPAKRDSRNLMAGAAGATIGLSALRNIQRDKEPQPD